LSIYRAHLHGPVASTPRPATIISPIIRRNVRPPGGRGWASASIKKCGAVPGRYRLEGWRLIWASKRHKRPRRHSGAEAAVRWSHAVAGRNSKWYKPAANPTKRVFYFRRQ
jgi:hypothetical protein